MNVFLALHLPKPSLESGRILAISRDPRLLTRFRDTVLRDAQRAVESASTDLERQVAEVRLKQMRDTLELVCAQEAKEEAPCG